MNTSTIISNKELDLLKSMIGKTFDQYKCDPYVSDEKIYRPHSWNGFGKGEDATSTDYRACEHYGPLYK